MTRTTQTAASHLRARGPACLHGLARISAKTRAASSTDSPPVHFTIRVGQRLPNVSEAFSSARAAASPTEEKTRSLFDTRPMPSYDTTSPPLQLIERFTFMYSWARKTTR